MAVKIVPLSDAKIKAAKPKLKDYVLSDGDGLQLRVRANGSRQWNFNYRHPSSKKRINIGLGTYPTVSLIQARKKAAEARVLVAQGTDPKEERQEAAFLERSATEHTLQTIAKDWFEVKKDSVTPNYAEDIWGSFERHVFPALANTPIAKITAPSVINILRPLEAKGSLETVKRIIQRLNEVMVYAVNGGIIFANPLSGIRSNFKKPKRQHMAALKPDELTELLTTGANASIKRVTRCLIEWQLHTMTRPAEAAGTRWDEIDMEHKTWTISAARMKKRREHVVPLTNQMLALLDVVRPISGHREYVFPADRDPKTHCNSQTANMALKRMGLQGRLVSHGLRSLASTTLNEEGFESDLIEAALAHVDNNQVRSAYNRTNYLERRRPMMDWWSTRIQKAAEGSLLVTGLKG